MIHYSCDRCKRVLDSQDLRYTVRLEIEAVMDPVNEGELDDDRDHLMEIEDLLERSDADDCPEIGDDIYQRRRFDLCPECYRSFARNPLGREVKAALDFSQN